MEEPKYLSLIVATVTNDISLLFNNGRLVSDACPVRRCVISLEYKKTKTYTGLQEVNYNFFL